MKQNVNLIKIFFTLLSFCTILPIAQSQKLPVNKILDDLNKEIKTYDKKTFSTFEKSNSAQFKEMNAEIMAISKLTSDSEKEKALEKLQVKYSKNIEQISKKSQLNLSKSCNELNKKYPNYTFTQRGREIRFAMKPKKPIPINNSTTGEEKIDILKFKQTKKVDCKSSVLGYNEAEFSANLVKTNSHQALAKDDVICEIEGALFSEYKLPKNHNGKAIKNMELKFSYKYSQESSTIADIDSEGMAMNYTLFQFGFNYSNEPNDWDYLNDKIYDEIISITSIGINNHKSEDEVTRSIDLTDYMGKDFYCVFASSSRCWGKNTLAIAKGKITITKLEIVYKY